MSKDLKVSLNTCSQGPAIIVAVITILCLAPFLNKAFHIDDPLFLWAAKHIQTDPINFYGLDVNWYGTVMPMYEVAKNPPGASYYIAAAASLLGWSEIALHTVFLIPAVAVAVGTYYLAKRFCPRPATAALATVLTPGFLVSSTNIMCDTMMLAFWVWAVFLWVRGIDENKYPSLFFAAVLVTLCALTKYFGIALLPLLIVYSLVKKRKLGVWLLFFLIPAAILTAYQLVTRNLYGRGLLTDAAAYAREFSEWQKYDFSTRGLTGLLFTGGTIAVVLFYIPFLWSRLSLIFGFLLTILFILMLSFTEKIGIVPISDINGIKWPLLIQIGITAVVGICILVLAGTDLFKFKNAESIMLLLWVFGTFIFAAFINWTVNVRSILPMTPAIGIILMRKINKDNREINRGIRKWQVVLPLIPAAALSLLICWADYTWANTARTAAKDIKNKYGDISNTVWFEGHWGFQYYMESEDFIAIDYKNLKITGNDIIIIPYNNTNTKPFPKEIVDLIWVFQIDSSRIITISDGHVGAGFYSDIWGPLPYVFGKVEPEKYLAFKVGQ